MLRSALERADEATFAALPDFHIDPLSVVGDEDDVYVHWRITGTHAAQTIDVSLETTTPIPTLTIA